MALTLGSVEFTVDEMPERVQMGGTQNAAVRRYAGGGIDVQTLGAFDDAISWEGTLWFEKALSRAQAINEMRLSGKPIKLQIGGMTGNVVVTRFHFTYEHDFHVPYNIELQPLAPIKAVGSPNPVQVQVTTPLTTPAVLKEAQTAATPMAVAKKTTSPSYNVARLFGLGANTPLGTIINQMAPAGTGEILSTVSQVSHLVSVGESLWSIATKHYGNGSLWTRIASANNLLNPGVLEAGRKLIIPSPTRTVTK